MRIAILVSLFPPNDVGGTEVATLHIARHLARRGHEVHVVTTWAKGLPVESNEEGFCIHRGKIISRPFIGLTSYLLHTLRVIKKVNPDLIHTQSITLALYAFIIKRILRKPYVAWAQGADIYKPSILNRWLYQFTLASANAVIAQTSDEKRVIQKSVDRDLVVIPNGIDLYRFTNLSREEVRSQLQIKEREKIVIFVGRLVLVKGVKYLIHAMETVSHRCLEARLIVVGEGKEKNSLEKLTNKLGLGDVVTFIGGVSNENVLEYMAAADILALPSLSEGFPVVILEALASGLPVVTTDILGLPEIICDGENGLLVAPKNIPQIAEKVLLLLQDNELRRKISQNNRQKVKNYTWDKAIDRLEQVYLSTNR